MLHDKRSGKARHSRISLVALGVAATGAAAFVAATAVPAFANGSHGNSPSSSHGASHSQGASHSKAVSHRQNASHPQKSSHSQTSAHGQSGSHGNSGSRGNSANAHEHVTICHATPPDTAAGGYVQISPSAAGVYNGHLKEHAADIIPPFTYNGQTYSLNWDATGQAIFGNSCVAPSSTNGASHSTNGTSHSTQTNKAKVLAAAKAAFHAIVTILKPTSAHKSGVAAAHKALKRVTHHARAAHAATRAASFTG